MYRRELTTCKALEPKDGKKGREGFTLYTFSPHGCDLITTFLAPAVDVKIAGVDQGKGLMSEKMGKRAPWTEPVSL